MVWSRKLRPAIFTVALAALSLVSLGACTSPQTTFSPVSDVADSIHTIYLITIIGASLVGGAVLVAMVWLMLKFRAKPGVPPRQIHGNNRLEIAWTIAPMLVLLTIALPTMFWIAGTAGEPSDDAVEITAVGHQWWFEFRYPGMGPDGGDLVTANEMWVPVGREVSVTLESEDVIHSFWVPQLVGKTDMIPGRQNKLHTFTAYEPGEYHGQCVEFCGVAHALMRFRVHVVTQGQFEQWVDAMNSPAPAPPPTFGSAGCSGCHAIQGTAFGEVGPNLTLFGERTTVGAGILDNTHDNLAQWIGDIRSLKPVPPVGEVGPGASPVMPQFVDTLSEAEIDQLTSYLQSLTIE